MLKPIADPDLNVFVAWVPILGRDSPEEADLAMRRLPDRRVSHYWDDGSAMQAFRDTLGLPEGTAAWDLYLLFDRETRWDNPPSPVYWMHQLDLADKPRLNGDDLAAELRRRIAQ